MTEPETLDWIFAADDAAQKRRVRFAPPTVTILAKLAIACGTAPECWGASFPSANLWLDSLYSALNSDRAHDRGISFSYDSDRNGALYRVQHGDYQPSPTYHRYRATLDDYLAALQLTTPARTAAVAASISAIVQGGGDLMGLAASALDDTWTFGGAQAHSQLRRALLATGDLVCKMSAHGSRELDRLQAEIDRLRRLGPAPHRAPPRPAFGL